MQKQQLNITPIKIDQDSTVVSQPYNENTAYLIKNMRVSTTENNTLLCLTNEKSNKKCAVSFDDEVIIGVQEISNYIVVFTTKDGVDSIYRISNPDSSLITDYSYYTYDSIQNKVIFTPVDNLLIYRGFLGFKVVNPIESLAVVETSSIKKIYWVDGINQARSINVSDEGIQSLINKYAYADIKTGSITIIGRADKAFDFIQDIQNNSITTFPSLEVSKIDVGNGSLPAGVIQYGVSYYNLYGQQTSIILLSDLCYTSGDASYGERGLSPEEKSGNAFKLVLKDSPANFDYARIYRIERTSENATASVEYLTDIKLDYNNIEYDLTAEDASILTNGGDSKIINIASEYILDEVSFKNSIEIDSTEDLWIGKQNIVPALYKLGVNDNFPQQIDYNKWSTAKQDFVNDEWDDLFHMGGETIPSSVPDISDTDRIINAVWNRKELIDPDTGRSYYRYYDTYEREESSYDTGTGNIVYYATSIKIPAAIIWGSNNTNVKYTIKVLYNNTKLVTYETLAGQQIWMDVSEEATNGPDYILHEPSEEPAPVGNLKGYFTLQAASLENGHFTRKPTYVPFKVKTVEDLRDTYDNNLSITDTGTTGTTVEPSELYYLGGQKLIPYTLDQKSNTLFLGNFHQTSTLISNDLKTKIQETSIVEFKYKDLNTEETASDSYIDYPIIENLNKTSSSLAYFQARETYRIGVQFIDNQGVWSEVVYLKDLQNHLPIVPNLYKEGINRKPIISVTLDNTAKKELLNANYIGCRVVCVFPNEEEREVICQGIVCPTVYNVSDRVDNSPYVQSSWYARPEYMGSNETFNNQSFITNRNNATGYPLEYRMIQNASIGFLPLPDKFNSEIQYGTLDSTNFTLIDKNITNRKGEIGKQDQLFGVDKTIFTFHSPEIDQNYADWMYNINLDNVKFRVVGYVPVKKTITDILCNISNPYNASANASGFNTVDINDDSWKNNNIPSGNGLMNYPFWVDSISKTAGSSSIEKIDGSYYYAAFPIYTWQKNNSVNNYRLQDGAEKSKLERKVISNLRVGFPTKYFNNDDIYYLTSISNINLYSDDFVSNKKIDIWNKTVNYYGTVDKILSANNYDSSTGEPIYMASLAPSTSDSQILISNKNIPIESLSKGDTTPFTSQGLTPPTDFNASTYKKLRDTFAEKLDNIMLYSSDPISIRYKSTPHAVLGLEKNSNGYYTLLPKVSIFNQENTSTSSDNKVTLLIENCSGKIESNDRKNIPYLKIMCYAWAARVDYPGFKGHKLTAQLTTTSGTLSSNNITSVEINYYVWDQVNNQVTSLWIDGSKVSVYPKDKAISEINNYTYKYSGFNTEIADDGITKYATVNLVKDLSSDPTNNSGYFITALREIRVNVSDGNVYKFNFSTTDSTIKYNDKDLLIGAGKSNTINYNEIAKTLTPSSANLEEVANADSSKNIIWEKAGEEFLGFKQDTIITSDDRFSDDNVYYYLLGEFYRDDVVNKFGGNSEEALAANTWVPCGSTIPLNTASTVEVIGDQGDTFFERYDHLKTYPYTEKDTNGVVEIVSFECETRINLDGRYDKNRGNKDNTYINNTNFNQFNKIYSQRNNFFSYTTRNSNLLVNEYFPNTITWSKTKTFGETIDTWTNFSGASVLDLDGNKGSINKILKYNDTLLSFQDKAVSIIHFNDRVQITASDNLPIELANTGKVNGYQIIIDNIGCVNKWSIASGINGVYFVDANTRKPYRYSGQLSVLNGMDSWFRKQSMEVWNPTNFSIRTLMDASEKDVYYTTGDITLSYNEYIGAFTSFYDYDKVSFLVPLNHLYYQFKYGVNNIYNIHQGSDYMNFFDNNKNYEVEIIGNVNFIADKVFDTLEFRTNDLSEKSTAKFGSNTTYNLVPFNKMVTSNEYQEAIVNSSTLRKKFRIWRWPIGRDTTFKRDRIRNPWAKIHIEGNLNTMFQLYDLAVTYYI
jgi:hypothetical protein